MWRAKTLAWQWWLSMGCQTSVGALVPSTTPNFELMMDINYVFSMEGVGIPTFLFGDIIDGIC
jgi:hypothetical protein